VLPFSNSKKGPRTIPNTAWMDEMCREGFTGWWLVGKVVSQAGGCGRGLDVKL